MSPRLPVIMPSPQESILEEALSSILSSDDLELVIARIASLLRNHFGKTRLSLSRCLESPPNIAQVLIVIDPHNPNAVPGRTFSLSDSLSGQAIRQASPVLLEELHPENPRYPEEKNLAENGFASAACFPLIVDSRILGTLELAHPPRPGALAQCVAHAALVSRLVAIALNNSLLLSEVRRLNDLLRRDNQVLQEQLVKSNQGKRYVASSPIMQKIMEQLRKAAQTDVTVLIQGETGCGKEGIARLIHELSPRCANPFVTVDLGALPESLIESELFGHAKGAFTGALARRLGNFELAHGGTIFLDEIGDASPSAQVKLLRALQEHEVVPVGSNTPVKFNVRVLAATHRPLQEMVANGTFRQDLFYRLNGFPLAIPPLRDRPDDFRPLCRHFLALHAAHLRRPVPSISEDQFSVLQNYSWPGNIRELENYLERAIILSNATGIELPALPNTVPAASLARSTETWDQIARKALVSALDQCEGKIYGAEGAAQLLQIPPSTLQGKLRKHGIRYE